MFFQIICQYFTHCLVNSTHHFVVTQLRFSLSFKLWFSYFYRNNGSQTFTEVISRDFNLHLFQHLAVFGVFLQRTGQRTAETCQVCTTFDSVDIVNVWVNVFGESGIVHDSHFNRNSLFFRVQIDNVVNQVLAWRLDKTYKLSQTFFWIKLLTLEASVLVHNPTVRQGDAETSVQISQFAQTWSQNLVIVYRFCKDGIIRPELLAGSSDVGCTDFFYRVKRFTDLILLLIDFTIAEYLRSHVGRQRVYARHTYTVQTSGYLVRTLVEFTSGMQYGHGNFQCRLLFFLVIVHRNTASVVLYCDWIVFVDCYFDVVAITGQCFVDRVVNDFVYQMVKSLDADVTNVHRRAFSYCFKTFQYLDTIRRIRPVIGSDLFFAHNCLSNFNNRANIVKIVDLAKNNQWKIKNAGWFSAFLISLIFSWL